MKMNTLKSDFLRAISTAGIKPPQDVAIDGHIHRFSTNDKIGDNAGWYVLKNHGDFTFGAFGDWRTGIQGKWSSKDESQMSEVEKDEMWKEIRRIKKSNEEDRLQKQKKVAEKAERIWESAELAESDHPYLVRKGVKSYGLKKVEYDGLEVLLVPLVDEFGKIWSFQRIYPDQRRADKILLKNGRTTGLYFTIGDLSIQRVVCEGYATGASIHAATGYCVHVAFSAGNLREVAQTIRKLHSDVDLFIAADDDYKTDGNPGLTKATEACRSSKAKIVIPVWSKDRGEKETDFNDLLKSEGPHSIKTCFEKAGRPLEEKTDSQANKTQDESEDKSSIATKLVNLTEAECELFKDKDGETYARIPTKEHHEVYRIRSKEFGDWLKRTFYRKEFIVPNDAALNSAIGTVDGIAKYDCEEKEVFLRIAQIEDQIYLDLVDDKWRCVEITKHGWKVLESSPITFYRNSNLKPLPEPKKEGDIELIWKHINILKTDRLLLLSWLVECFRRNTPDPLLELTGEHGSGKTDSHKLIKDLIDPNKVNLRSLPDKNDNLLVQAKHALIVCFDNVSILKDSMQDLLCSISTGGGYAVRQLYTTTDETVVELQRPVALNGISPVVSRPDLLDRSLVMEIPLIKNRKTRKNIEEELNYDRPLILGGLLSLVCNVLDILPSIKIASDQLPRMSDFAYCGEAVYKIFGRDKGEFLKDYNQNRSKGIQRILESSPTGMALIDYIEEHPFGFKGTIKELLEILEKYKSPSENNWIRSARGLGDMLRRLKPALRQSGIDVQLDPDRKRDGFHVSITKINKTEKKSCEHGEHCEHVSEKKYSHADIEEF